MKRTTKLVSVLLAVLIALSSFAILPISAFDHSSKAPGSSYEFGDVNRDGVIDIMDATLIQKKAVDKANFDNEQMILGDVNGDGEVDIIDATLVQKFVVERIDKFPVEDKLPTEPTTIEEPTEAPEGDYYILGTMNGWSVSDDYKLTANEAADGEFVFTGLKLKTTDKFKVAYSVAGAEPTMWFPNGYNDNYGQHGEITADGTYDLYFRPDGDWFNGVIYAANQDEPQPTEEVTTVAPEPDTTAEPGETITVKFTDALSWGDVHVYYWPNGAEWPGTAMEKAEVNDYGQQVYTAEIPANVDIADGAQWYTIDEKEGKNYKVTLVGSEPETEQPTDATEQPTTVETFPKSFYVDFTAVLGQGTNWYAWTWDDSHDGVWRPVEKFGYVAAYDNVVFASFNTDTPNWDNVVVQTEDVKVDDGNTLYILNEKDENSKLKTSWKPVEQPTTAEPTVVTEPTEEPTETTPANTITIKFTDALSWGDVHVYYWNNGAEWPGTAMEKAEVNDFGQQVYTAEIPADVDGIIFNGNGNQTVDIKTDIADGAQWYTIDEKEDNKYKVTLVGSEPATEQPTEVVEPTTEAPTEATDPTEDQSDTITIKFTDALGWGNVHVHYWPNGAEWPGTAMEKAEVNDFGQQVYTAEIPADVEGIIFNGNGNQTVDIKTDIADGAQWYTVDEKEGNKYKVTLVGEETQPTEDPTPEPTGRTVKLQPNDNWTQSGARFAIYVYGDNGEAWADMTAVGDGTYTVTVPEGNWKNVIFVRMNPASTVNNWNNKWNQSADLEITYGKLYTVPSNSWDNWQA